MALVMTRLDWQCETEGQSAILVTKNQAILGGQNSLLVLPYLGLPRIGNMRTYAATDKLFLTYHPQSEERHIRLVTELSFSAISTEQLEGGVSPYEPVVTISPVEKQGRGLLSSHPPAFY